jgi:hypothetical protein
MSAAGGTRTHITLLTNVPRRRGTLIERGALALELQRPGGRYGVAPQVPPGGRLPGLLAGPVASP